MCIRDRSTCTVQARIFEDSFNILLAFLICRISFYLMELTHRLPKEICEKNFWRQAIMFPSLILNGSVKTFWQYVCARMFTTVLHEKSETRSRFSSCHPITAKSHRCQIMFVTSLSVSYTHLDVYKRQIDYIAEIKLNYSTVYYLLKLLDEKAYRDISYTMFSILFGVPNKSFFRAIRKSSEPVKELMLNKSGSIERYGLRYSKVYWSWGSEFSGPHFFTILGHFFMHRFL